MRVLRKLIDRLKVLVRVLSLTKPAKKQVTRGSGARAADLQVAVFPHSQGAGKPRGIRRKGRVLRSCTRRDKSTLVGEHDGLDAIPETKLAEDAVDVGLDSGRADDQFLCDLSVR